jgi:glucose/mannose transport system substrate-binding protein
MKHYKTFLAGASVLALTASVNATELEVTHWWTSGGEAAAVAEFAKAFDATGNKWVDGAIAGGGGTARPIMISRITGGDPMAATQFNHGQQACELVEAGLMLDLTDVAEREGWKDVIYPAVLLDSPARSMAASTACRSTSTRPSGCGCRMKPLRRPVFRFRPIGTSSLPRPRQLEAAGKSSRWRWAISPGSPTSLWCHQTRGRGSGSWKQINVEKDMDAAAGPEMAKVFEAAARCPETGRKVDGAGLEPGHQPGHHRSSRWSDHGRLGAGRIRCC